MIAQNKYMVTDIEKESRFPDLAIEECKKRMAEDFGRKIAEEIGFSLAETNGVTELVIEAYVFSKKNFDLFIKSIRPYIHKDELEKLLKKLQEK